MPISANNTFSQIKSVNKPTTASTVQKPDTSEKKPVSNKVLAAGLVGLAALASVGVYMATRGKGKCNIKPQNTEEVVENIQQKLDKIVEDFDKTIYKDWKKSVEKLKNGKTKVTLVNDKHKTIYVYDKNANPEKMVAFNEFGGYQSFVQRPNGGWDLVKVKYKDAKTGDTVIEKLGANTKPISRTTISRETHDGMTEFEKHTYEFKKDCIPNEYVTKLKTMQDGDVKMGQFSSRKQINHDSEGNNIDGAVWETLKKYTLKNNEKVDKPMSEVFTEAQMDKWKKALGF